MFSAKDLEMYKESLKQKKLQNKTPKASEMSLKSSPPNGKVGKPPPSPNRLTDEDRIKSLKEPNPISNKPPSPPNLQGSSYKTKSKPVSPKVVTESILKRKPVSPTSPAEANSRPIAGEALQGAKFHSPSSKNKPSKEPSAGTNNGIVQPKAGGQQKTPQKALSLNNRAAGLPAQPSLCSECTRAASEGAVCFIGNDGRVSACTTRFAVRLCKNLNCAANNPEYVAALAATPKKYLISKRHSLKAQYGPKRRTGNTKTSTQNDTSQINSFHMSPDGDRDSHESYENSPNDDSHEAYENRPDCESHEGHESTPDETGLRLFDETIGSCNDDFSFSNEDLGLLDSLNDDDHTEREQTDLWIGNGVQSENVHDHQITAEDDTTGDVESSKNVELQNENVNSDNGDEFRENTDYDGEHDIDISCEEPSHANCKNADSKEVRIHNDFQDEVYNFREQDEDVLCREILEDNHREDVESTENIYNGEENEVVGLNHVECEHDEIKDEYICDLDNEEKRDVLNHFEKDECRGDQIDDGGNRDGLNHFDKDECKGDHIDNGENRDGLNHFDKVECKGDHIDNGENRDGLNRFDCETNEIKDEHTCDIDNNYNKDECKRDHIDQDEKKNACTEGHFQDNINNDDDNGSKDIISEEQNNIDDVDGLQEASIQSEITSSKDAFLREEERISVVDGHQPNDGNANHLVDYYNPDNIGNYDQGEQSDSSYEQDEQSDCSNGQCSLQNNIGDGEEDETINGQTSVNMESTSMNQVNNDTKDIETNQGDGMQQKVSKRTRRRPIPVVQEQPPETVTLRKQQIQGRKAPEEWMPNHAIEEVVSKLAPKKGEAKVKLLVEAFESIISQTDVIDGTSTETCNEEKNVFSST